MTLLDPSVTIDPTLISFIIGFFLYFDRRMRRLEQSQNRIEGFLKGLYEERSGKK